MGTDILLRIPEPATSYFPFFCVPAIEELGGHTAETATLAYQELHRLTGRQGKLRHVECLKAGEWNSSPSVPDFSTSALAN